MKNARGRYAFLVAAVLALRPTLLILDNCEHVIQVVASTVDDLLRAVPDLTICCTSRRSLGAAGEVVYEVVPLDLPEVGVSSDETLSAPSVELFLDRAAAAAPGFVPDEEATADVVAICRRLDGIPLAIDDREVSRVVRLAELRGIAMAGDLARAGLVELD